MEAIILRSNRLLDCRAPNLSEAASAPCHRSYPFRDCVDRRTTLRARRLRCLAGDAAANTGELDRRRRANGGASDTTQQQAMRGCVALYGCKSAGGSRTE